MTQTFNEDVVFNQGVKVDGNQDITQLRVEAHSTQNQPLQTWQDGGGNVLARITADGRLQEGNLGLGTPPALVEANDAITLPSTKPKQGWQSLGRLTGALTDAVAWVVHELELLGAGGVSGIHTALRAKLTHNNTGNATNAELRAGDFQAVNQSGASETRVGRITALRGASGNGPGAYLAKAVGVEATVSNDAGGGVTEAVAFEVTAPTNTGTIGALYGLRIPDLTQGTANVAIQTGQGVVRVGDHEELKVLTSTPTVNPPMDFVKVYPKLDAGSPKLYAKDAAGVEYLLTSSGGSGSVTLDLTVTAGEALAERDMVFISLSDGKAYKLDIDALPIKAGRIRGVIVQSGGIANGASGTLRLAGAVTGFSGLTPWAELWASETPGGYTQTKPVVSAGGGQRALLRLGYATSATAAMFWPNPAQFIKRELLAPNALTTLEHYADGPTYLRKVWGSNHITSTTLTSYLSVNADVNVQLRGGSAPGGTTSIVATGTTASIGNSPSLWAAQSFQVAEGKLSQLTFYLAVSVGTPSGGITWEIRNSVNNQPGSVLQSGNCLPTANMNNTIPVTNGVRLSASTTYWLVLKPTTAQTAGNAYTINTSSISAGFLRSNDGGATWTTSAVSTGMYCSVTTTAIAANDAVAQSFRLSSTGTVDAARLWLSKIGTPTGTLTLRVETDSAGAPSGTLADPAATVTVAESGLDASAGFILFDFSTNFALAANTTYWLVLSTSRAASGTNYVLWGADASSPAYASGEMRTLAGAAWIFENKDAIFEVTASATAYDEPCVIGRESGGTRDLTVRFDDGSGSNGDTRTTFRNTSQATADLTCLVELV